MPTNRPNAGPERGELAALPDGRRIRGHVEAGFGPVMDVFLANFRDRGDLGSGCTVYLDGRLVVDLWGGTADRRTGRPWDRDSAAVIFSCTKGVLAICAYRLVQEGRLDLDAPVARYWPEFAANGKAAITVRQLLSHRAGLPALDADLSREEVLAWEPVIRAIEAQRPLFAPSDGHFYHALTYGWLVGEVIRRVTGTMPGQWFRTEIADPLALRTWIGVPADARPTVAWMETPLPDPDTPEARAVRAAGANPITERGLTMGHAWTFPVHEGRVGFNDEDVQAAEVPGANGVSTAPSLARLYAACVSDAWGPRLMTDASIADALVVQSAGPMLSGDPDDGSRWGTGFEIAGPPAQPLLGPTSFGHPGAGGQQAFADLEHRVGFAYLSNQMGGLGDARARELVAALRSVLRA